MKIGVFGGTFNPPHFGHIQSVKAAVAQLGLDKLIIVPSATPPHKPVPDGTPSVEFRLNMAKLAFEDIPNSIVSDFEIKNGNMCYTIDTVTAIKRDFPESELFLLLGTDMYLSLYSWKDWENLLKLAAPAVFSRNNELKSEIENFSLTLREKFDVRAKIVDNTVLDISSSAIRDMLPNRGGIKYLDENVYSYIISNRLYGANPDWDWLRGKAHSMLDPKRVPHVIGCESEAVRLARHWGACEDEAREAGILHDITKKLDTEEQLQILRDHNIKIEPMAIGEEKLLHSKTGAVLAKSLFGVSDTVYNAIMWHTTGKAGMTDLDKIIYLADYIEPNRELDNIEILRELSYKNLNMAMAMGIQMSVTDLLERGKTPNVITLDALDSFKTDSRR